MSQWLINMIQRPWDSSLNLFSNSGILLQVARWKKTSTAVKTATWLFQILGKFFLAVGYVYIHNAQRQCFSNIVSRPKPREEKRKGKQFTFAVVLVSQPCYHVKKPSFEDGISGSLIFNTVKKTTTPPPTSSSLSTSTSATLSNWAATATATSISTSTTTSISSWQRPRQHQH